MLELAETLGYPALNVAGVPVAPGRNGWGAFVAGAGRRQFVQALGVLVARVHRQRES